MPLGLASTSKVFQKRNEATFDGIDGIVDDIVIAAATVKEYDMILHQVLARAFNHNVKLNLDKLKLCVNSV